MTESKEQNYCLTVADESGSLRIILPRCSAGHAGPTRESPRVEFTFANGVRERLILLSPATTIRDLAAMVQESARRG